MTIEDVEVLERILEHTITGASRCPVEVFWAVGHQQIRGGTRSVRLTTASLMTLVFDAEGIYCHPAIT